MEVIIFGAGGQMGYELTRLWQEKRPEDHLIMVDRNLEIENLEKLGHAHLLIDFSHADAIDEVLAYGIKNQTPLLIATTGHSAEAQKAIKSASNKIPIFYTANLSLGVFVLKSLTSMAMKLLGESADIEIIEKHHNKKSDAPSGTALMLKNELIQNKPDLLPVYGRSGQMKRRNSEVGIHAIRGGTITGEHTVLFAMEGETLELTHRGESKRLFAMGAYKAGLWLSSQSSGLYQMEDIKEREL